MAYTKIVFQNSPSTATPLNAENLNHMDDQIALNDQRLTEIETSYVKSFNGRKGDVTTQSGDYNIGQIAPTNGATVGQIPIVRNDGTAEEPNLTFHMEDVPSSGHVIKDQSGTSLAQEDAMQFADAFVSDDPTNGKTVVENIKEVAPADYDSTTDEGIIVTDDGNDALIGAVSDDYVEVVADGDKTYETLLNELFTDVELDKLKENSAIVVNISGEKYVYHIVTYYLDTYEFEWSRVRSDKILKRGILLRNNNSTYTKSENGTITPASSEKPSNGTKITLYYGNKKAVVDLQTTANRCWYDEETTVKQKIDEITVIDTFTCTTDSISMITLPSKSGYRLTSFFTKRTNYVERYCINENDPSVAHVTVSDYNGTALAQGTSVNVVAYYQKI